MNDEKNFREIKPNEEIFCEFWRRINTDPKPPESIFAKFSQSEADFAKIFRKPSVAIVGSRKPTEYGQRVTLELSRKLAEHGVVIVSGLALGHDALAHRGALNGGGTTVAILGTPIDKIYPRQNFQLAQDILENNGAILSEIAPGEKFFAKTSFLERNRLISALADIVIVVEANLHSGSLNTARHAMKQEKILMAVPGNITSPLSAGTNQLIANGAAPVLSADSILARLREMHQDQPSLFDISSATNFQKLNLSADQQAILTALKREGGADMDDLSRILTMPTPELSSALTLLEIEGQISRSSNEWSIK